MLLVKVKLERMTGSVEHHKGVQWKGETFNKWPEENEGMRL